MKSIVLLLVVIGFAGPAVTQDTNYCDKSLCGNQKHIACDNTGDLATSCPKDTDIVNFTDDLTTAIVNKHNELRNALAQGKLDGFKPSERMATMKWNEELAKLAALNVKTCKFAHDACRNTNKFPHSGQNLAQTWTSVEYAKSSIPSMTTSLVDSWWSEYMNATMKEINSYPATFEAVIGHFTVMAIDSNTDVGCAIADFRDPDMDNWYTLLLACNYARINFIKDNIYTSGETASKCKTGTNPKYPGLCSEEEQYEL